MKIYDIIHESKALDEGLERLFVPLLTKLGFGAADTAVVRALEKLTAKWAEDMAIAAERGEAVNLTNTRRFLKGEGLSDAQINKILQDKAALRAAAKEAKSQVQKAQVARVTASAGKGYRTAADIALLVARHGSTAYLIYEPAKFYADNMQNAEDHLAAGNITPDEFNAMKKQQLSIMIGKITTNILGAGMIKGFVKPFSIGLRFVGKGSNAGFANVLADTLDGLSIAGKVWLTNIINDPDNAKIIATVFGNAIASEYIGGPALEAVNKVKEWFGMADAQGAANPNGTPNKPEQGAKPTDPTGANTPATTPGVYSHLKASPAGPELKTPDEIYKDYMKLGNR